MKLSPAQLEQHLTKSLSSIYIVSGEELLLKHDAMQLIHKAAKKSGIHERARLTPGIHFTWDDLYHLLNSTSLLAEKRLLEFDFRENLPEKTIGQCLKEYAEHPSPNHIILIDMGKVDDKTAKTPWYTALEKAGMVITCWPITREQLPQWISNRAKKYALQMNADAVHLLADYVEGNLIAAAQTLEKVYLLKPEKPIDAALIETLLTDESRYTIFDFIENLIAKDKTRTLHILHHLKIDHIEPALILWSITRELRLLAELAQQRKHSEIDDVLFKKFRIFPRRQASVRQFLTTVSPEDCWRYLIDAARIDKIMKGATPGDIWVSLQLFCLRLITS